jgi:hypothetical protein
MLHLQAAAADYAARSAQYERDLLAHQFKAIAAEQSRMAAQLRAITAVRGGWSEQSLVLLTDILTPISLLHI